MKTTRKVHHSVPRIWDGFWERIIKDIKRCLKKAIERVLLNDNEFVNLLMTVSPRLTFSAASSRPSKCYRPDKFVWSRLFAI